MLPYLLEPRLHERFTSAMDMVDISIKREVICLKKVRGGAWEFEVVSLSFIYLFFSYLCASSSWNILVGWVVSSGAEREKAMAFCSLRGRSGGRRGGIYIFLYISQLAFVRNVNRLYFFSPFKSIEFLSFFSPCLSYFQYPFSQRYHLID